MRKDKQAITHFPKCAFAYPHFYGRKIRKQNRRLVAASLTGISPRPMLMGAPHDALRASNAGVSLRVPVVMANRMPPCFRTTPVSLPPHGRSWRALFSGSHRHERTCLLYDTRSAFFKEHGHIGPQPRSILLTAAASLYKTHSGSARGDTPPLWAEGAKPCRAYLRRKAATISMNCAFVGGCDNGWPAICSSKLWSGCLQHA